MTITPELTLEEILNTRSDFRVLVEELKLFVNSYEQNTPREPGATYKLNRVIDLALLPKEARETVTNMVVQAMYRLRLPIEMLIYSGVEQLPEDIVQLNNLRWTDEVVKPETSMEVYQIEPNTTLH